MNSAGHRLLHQAPPKRFGFGADSRRTFGPFAGARRGGGRRPNHARVPVQDLVRHHPQELVVLDRPAALVLGVRENLQGHVRHQHQELVVLDRHAAIVLGVRGHVRGHVLDLHGCRRAPLLVGDFVPTSTSR